MTEPEEQAEAWASMTSNLGQLSAMLFGFYKALTAQGFTPEQALQIVIAYLQTQVAEHGGGDDE